MGGSAVGQDWCHLMPYCSELRGIDVTGQDGVLRQHFPRPISNDTKDCFFLTNVSKTFEIKVLKPVFTDFSEHQVPSLFRGENIVCAHHSNTSRSQLPQNYKNKYTKTQSLRVHKQEH